MGWYELAEFVDTAHSGMEANVRNGEFEIREVQLTQHGFTYDTFELTGYLAGERVRNRFKTRDLAVGAKTRLEVKAANGAGDVRAVVTRLTDVQVRTAETLFALTPDPLAAVQWYLANFRTSAAETLVEAGTAAFLADRTPHISPGALRDYTRTLGFLSAMFPKRHVHTFTGLEVEELLKKHASGPKRHNNMRGDLHAFFNYCLSPVRKWTRENPVVGTMRFKIARGIPEIITADKAAELMAFVETYACGERAGEKPGCLVPYFALCLFAGIRPSVDDGEIRKLGESADVEKLIDRKLGVIRITPEISKVDAVRQVKIRENLDAWLAAYPLKDYPVVLQNMQYKVSIVRKRFGLSSDVLRHTFISNHVAKWQSLGAAALEAGNSEAMIRRHYLNLVSEADASAFWAIIPQV
jgi:hypothetical protein